MNLSIGGKIKLGFAVALFVALFVTISFIHSTDLAKANHEWVTHTINVLRAVESLSAKLAQAESAARGYELTKDAAFRDQVLSAPGEITPIVAELRSLTADNADQQKRVADLDPILSVRLHDLAQLVDLQSTSAAQRAESIQLLVRDGSARERDARRILGELAREERQLLADRQGRANQSTQGSLGIIGLSMLGTIVIIALTGFLVTHSIVHPLETLRDGAERIGNGDYAHRVELRSRDEIGLLASMFNRMAEQIDRRQTALADQDWLKTSLARVAGSIQAERNLERACQAVLTELATFTGALHSVFYVRESGAGGETVLRPKAAYGFENPKSEIRAGEGLAGQCLRDGRRIQVEQTPPNYLHITSSLGGSAPVSILVLPILFAGQIRGVLEMASFQKCSDIQLQFLDQLAISLGIALNSIEASDKTDDLLNRTSIQAEHLQKQRDELDSKNGELKSQAEQLRISEQHLQEQQEELQQANEELQQANEELQQANVEMEEKAEQLARASQYKTEFLAGMSHELRTPLNSLLILSKILADNATENLTPKQVEYATTIYTSGNDLLELINDILDLSKIESGSAEPNWDEVRFDDVVKFVETTFRHMAEQKKLAFRVVRAPNLPDSFQSDFRRLNQTLKNLLSNAFKFTERGSVELRIRLAEAGRDWAASPANSAGGMFAFDVVDTGIGISPEKHEMIFEAFRQADSGTARRYGGTGLGLSISRKIAQMLGGFISVDSELGAGSTFTFFLPKIYSPALPAPLPNVAAPSSSGQQLNPPRASRVDPPLVAPVSSWGDDRHSVRPGDLVLLVVEDDAHFAAIMVELAREKGFKPIVARTASEALFLANQITPSIITLDLLLPDNDGWMVLDRLKHDPRTRHIPVHIVSVTDERDRCLRMGAVSFLEKPVTRETLEHALSRSLEFIRRAVKRLLVIEDDATASRSIVELIEGEDVETEVAATGAGALGALDQRKFDCIVLDLGLPDMDGMALIREIQKRADGDAPPIIVYTGRTLTREEETQLRHVSDCVIVKDVRSPERLLDETSLFLHRPQANLPEAKRKILDQLRKSDPVLNGRTALVVDDDVRNIFAIASALENVGMQILHAENGQGALDAIAANNKIDVVLMDVMMPEMDGNETVRRIRKMPGHQKLPIISLTAKAMPGDRETCLQAGASDYITKPVNMEKLKSLLRVWLYR